MTAPPSKGMILSTGRFCSFIVRYASSFPSGEITGKFPLLVSCAGAPPSIDTLHTDDRPELMFLSTTHRPSGDQDGANASPLLVNCLGLAPSMSILQMLAPPARPETNTT